MAINKENAVGEKSSVLGKAITYIVLGLLAITIIIPVAWVFMASVKENSEFYGNPFALPKGILEQLFISAGETFFNHKHQRFLLCKYSDAPKRGRINFIT